MNAASWIVLAVAMLAAAALFWAVVAGGERRNRPNPEVIDVREPEPTHVTVLDAYDAARRAEQDRRGGTA